jgi:hypothetical protein
MPEHDIVQRCFECGAGVDEPCRPGCPGRRAIAIAMTISPAEQAHQAALRERSWELAIARGHVRR